MKEGIVRNWGYYGPNNPYGDLKITEGQCFAGFVAGILIAEASDYKPVGHIANALSFPYGVRYSIIKSISDPNADEETIANEIREAAKQLEIEGVRFIVSGGRELGKYQQVVADAVDLPVFMTSLMQLKWIKIGLRSAEKILVLSDMPAEKAVEVCKACGVPQEYYDDCVYLQIDPATMDAASVLDYLKTNNIIDENNIKAALLDTQIFAEDPEALKKAFGINVWTMQKLMGYVKKAVCQKPRQGFL